MTKRFTAAQKTHQRLSNTNLLTTAYTVSSQTLSGGPATGPPRESMGDRILVPVSVRVLGTSV